MYVNERTRNTLRRIVTFGYQYGKTQIMKTRFAITCVVCSTLIGTAAVLAADDSTSDTSHAVAYVKDSAVTTDIKTKLAAEHITSLQRIHVETDKDGVVWLSGSASTQKAADKAVAIARATDRVTNVHSDISVKSAD